MHRRHFLAAGTAAALATPGWALAGAPAFVTAASKGDTSTWIVGLSAEGAVCFSFPIPGRGHAAALHPSRAEAVAMARRPGTFAVVMDCSDGSEVARLTSPEGRHFYGHGAYSADGRYLLTTENAYDVPEGRIGVWDAAEGYVRVDDLPSGGIGPHEMIRLARGGFAVANGGIQTHPDYDRKKLNIPTMRPNLTYLGDGGGIEETVEPPAAYRQNSIRHIAAAGDMVAIALQWQGNPMTPVPLLATHRRGSPLAYHDHSQTARLKQYAGSIAIAPSSREIALTGPKGDYALFFDASGAELDGRELPVAAGAAPAAGGLAFTIEGGLAFGGSGGVRTVAVPGGWSWDNHLVALG
ncbi:DUF1513 domain-containing protein [Tropicimonas isoalkanivorans]|uniref:DUF1513 domain-containing protein n=1 Tax=Tropicimonas isoalkanivorans TaxID=441112 RepID=A0A1I1P712_9RHOB|nr:DUF1513 domain-containing protein [Tropicimonas isoalkanivorans]SFD05617.1 hypothetical protein SAMN04488094_11435 [Tropicimonas isoalkanivorans]